MVLVHLQAERLRLLHEEERMRRDEENECRAGQHYGWNFEGEDKEERGKEGVQQPRGLAVRARPGFL